jgi:hypothetical protein
MRSFALCRLSCPEKANAAPLRLAPIKTFFVAWISTGTFIELTV